LTNTLSATVKAVAVFWSMQPELPWPHSLEISSLSDDVCRLASCTPMVHGVRQENLPPATEPFGIVGVNAVSVVAFCVFNSQARFGLSLFRSTNQKTVANSLCNTVALPGLAAA
jgi:hypothetical protein